MNCPTCSVPLHITERQGVEIDYCPQCRGVWLDRGELDKIIERNTTERSQPGYIPQSIPEHRRERYDHGDDRDYKKKKRKSFLDDIFDF